MEIPKSIYFGGCANGGVFYIGVYKAMVDKWGADFPQKTIIYGDSSGVLMVLAITRQISPEDLGELYKECGRNSPYGIFSCFPPLEKYLLLKLLDDLKDPLLHETLNGQMCIGHSTFFANHVWKSEWDNVQDLYKCIVDSFNIPFLNNSKLKSRHACVDGAFVFSGKDLPHGDSTLYVADDPHADIRAHFTSNELIYSNLHEDFDRLFQKGYAAFMEWDGTYKEKVQARKPKYGIQCFLWFLFLLEKIMESFNFECLFTTSS